MHHPSIARHTQADLCLCLHSLQSAQQQYPKLIVHALAWSYVGCMSRGVQNVFLHPAQLLQKCYEQGWPWPPQSRSQQVWCCCVSAVQKLRLHWDAQLSTSEKITDARRTPQMNFAHQAWMLAFDIAARW